MLDIVVTGQFTAKQEKREALLQLVKAMFQPSRIEEGCIFYQFYEDPFLANQFLFLERWKNQNALDTHFKTEHFQNFMKIFPSLIEGELLISTYSVERVNEERL